MPNEQIPPIPPGGRFRVPGRGGRGRQPGGFGLGPGNFCVCPRCKTRIPHKRGVPCYEEVCLKCGTPMTRVR